jgi:hypothetical protein
MLTVLKEIRKGDRKLKYYTCSCECGEIKDIKYSSIGTQISCGCIKKKIGRRTTHGLSKTRIYGIWKSMKKRCHNPNSYDFNHYGAKGVMVCDEWRSNFMSFYNWSMANGYQEDLSIDRINGLGNYEPCNCRWVTMSVQQNNKPNMPKKPTAIINGIELTLEECAEKYNINYYTIRTRYHVGKRGEELIEPLKRNKRRSI